MINKIKQFFKRVWKWVVGFFVVVTAFVGIYGNIGNTPILGAPQLNADNKTVDFTYTDENTNENLIIRSDSGNYQNGSFVYFSVQNTTATNQNLDIVFTLKDNKTKLTEIQEFVSTNDIQTIASQSQPSRTKSVSTWNNKTTVQGKSPTNPNKKTVVGTESKVFESSLAVGETKFYKAKIDFPEAKNHTIVNVPLKNGIGVNVPVPVTQEFFIEAFGDNGGYGHLDPIAFDAAGSHNQATTGSNTLSSFTITGSNIYLVVGVFLRQAGVTTTGVTANGVGMTKLGEIDADVGLSMWGLAGAASGDIVATFSGSTVFGSSVIAISYTGVAQSGSVGTTVTNTGTGTSTTVTVSTTTGEMVVDVGADTNGSGDTHTAGANQTSRVAGFAGGLGWRWSSEQAGADGGVMTWDITSSSPWSAIATPLKPATASTVKKQSEILLD